MVGAEGPRRAHWQSLNLNTLPLLPIPLTTPQLAYGADSQPGCPQHFSPALRRNRLGASAGHSCSVPDCMGKAYIRKFVRTYTYITVNSISYSYISADSDADYAHLCFVASH